MQTDTNWIKLNQFVQKLRRPWGKIHVSDIRFCYVKKNKKTQTKKPTTNKKVQNNSGMSSQVILLLMLLPPLTASNTQILDPPWAATAIPFSVLKGSSKQEP